MLNIKNLEAKVDNKHILNRLNLDIKPGEVHAIMGPNGSGKSTLANVLSGKNGYEIKGEIKYNGQNLSELSTEERAQKGIFLAFQYPLEIPGVNTNVFLRTSLNSVRKARGEKELDTLSFLKLVKEKSSELGIDENGGTKHQCELAHACVANTVSHMAIKAEKLSYAVFEEAEAAYGAPLDVRGDTRGDVCVNFVHTSDHSFEGFGGSLRSRRETLRNADTVTKQHERHQTHLLGG